MHQPTARTKKACKYRPFAKRLKGIEPSTFSMASRTCVSWSARISPANATVLVCRCRAPFPRLSPGVHGGLGTQEAPTSPTSPAGVIERGSSLVDSAQRRHRARALARLFDARGEAGIADQLAGVGKAGDVADLGGDHESEHGADTGDGGQHEQRRSARASAQAPDRAERSARRVDRSPPSASTTERRQTSGSPRASSSSSPRPGGGARAGSAAPTG
jgi:hypothetical protein